MLPVTRPAWGDPLFNARFKDAPEDFQVTENLDIPFSGEGEHLYLRIEKTGRNTADILNALKRCYKVPKKAIGVAGQKDRHAVTSQWFSVVTPEDDAPLKQWLASDDAPPIRLLETVRHSRKLRIGAHSSNTFVIRLKEVRCVRTDSMPESTDSTSILKTKIEQRLQTLSAHGFPNYFGPQRFGRGGSNVHNAVRWLSSTPSIPSIARDKRSLYLSAVRSAAFNRVLANRVQKGNWNQIRLGELCLLDGTNSVFRVTESEHEATVLRASQFDVHPSAPLIGDVGVDVSGNAYAQDQAVLATDPNHGVLVAALTKLRVDASHRSTRAMCRDLQHRWLDDGTLELSFTLAPGVFATTLLAEIFMECSE